MFIKKYKNLADYYDVDSFVVDVGEIEGSLAVAAVGRLGSSVADVVAVAVAADVAGVVAGVAAGVAAAVAAVAAAVAAVAVVAAAVVAVAADADADADAVAAAAAAVVDDVAVVDFCSHTTFRSQHPTIFANILFVQSLKLNNLKCIYYLFLSFLFNIFSSILYSTHSPGMVDVVSTPLN